MIEVDLNNGMFREIDLNNEAMRKRMNKEILYED